MANAVVCFYQHCEPVRSQTTQSSVSWLNLTVRVFSPKVTHCAGVTLAQEFVLTEHRAVAVGNRLPLHRQLHLDAGVCFWVEDGHAHALLDACSEHRGRSDQVAPERRAGERGGEREGKRADKRREERRQRGRRNAGRWRQETKERSGV